MRNKIRNGGNLQGIVDKGSIIGLIKKIEKDVTLSWIGIIGLSLLFIVLVLLYYAREFSISPLPYYVISGVISSLGITSFIILYANLKKETHALIDTVTISKNTLETDLETLKKENHELQSNLSVIRDILDNVKLGIVTLESDWNILYFNRHLADTFGVNRETVLGKDFLKIFSDLERAGFDKSILDIFPGGFEDDQTCKSYEIEKEMGDGDKRIFSYTVSILKNKKELMGAGIVVEDITEQREIEDKSSATDKTLSRTNKKLSEKIAELSRLYEDAKKGYFDTIRALAFAIEARSYYTREHSERVTHYALDIAKKMDLPQDTMELIQYAGRLHDIGKIGVKDVVLDKPGQLTASEFTEIKLHPSRGAEMLEPLDFLHDSLPSIRAHHERYDGRGYPDGLLKDKIPLVARILSVADTFDAMTTNRPYRKALSHEDAIKEIRKYSGSQFDPKIAQAFLQVLEKR